MKIFSCSLGSIKR